MEKTLTSLTLLETLATDSQSVRWTEFFAKYEPVMRAYLARHFGSLDADDIIQETMKALLERLPDYVYTPDAKGHFKSYLIGIVKHKANDQLRKDRRLSALHNQSAAENAPSARDDASKAEEEWKTHAMEAAVEQLLADASINPRNREIFRHLVLMRQPPERVAATFGVTRGNVDVIKKRMIDKLTVRVNAMLRVG